MISKFILSCVQILTKSVCDILSLLGYYVIVSRHGVVVIINILNIKLPSFVLLVTL